MARPVLWTRIINLSWKTFKWRSTIESKKKITQIHRVKHQWVGPDGPNPAILVKSTALLICNLVWKFHWLIPNTFWDIVFTVPKYVKNTEFEKTAFKIWTTWVSLKGSRCIMWPFKSLQSVSVAFPPVSNVSSPFLGVFSALFTSVA